MEGVHVRRTICQDNKTRISEKLRTEDCVQL